MIFSVFLFAISTAISWSYYGDRCANYLFGPRESSRASSCSSRCTSLVPSCRWL
ncbi:hypothetical protein [Candidatus Palauibacter sp.]|uniref:hypothetical protein n=1 Tax=Candidatus Palauibacter sp. TaxID=3101350 RepID=UPI003C6EC599